MQFDTTTTAAAFVVLVGLATAALVAAPMMRTQTVLIMVLPSIVIGGLVFVGLGVKYGEYRANR